MVLISATPEVGEGGSAMLTLGPVMRDDMVLNRDGDTVLILLGVQVAGDCVPEITRETGRRGGALDSTAIGWPCGPAVGLEAVAAETANDRAEDIWGVGVSERIGDRLGGSVDEGIGGVEERWQPS